MYQSRDPEALGTCPYDPSHRVRNYRMGPHIVKCRKAYQGETVMVPCLFNATHSIPEMEKQYHEENCTDRFNFDKHVMVPKDANPMRFPIEMQEIEDDENWDEEQPMQTYKPEEYCQKNPILRQMKVESAAVRKNFRTEERQRIQKLKDMGPSNTDAAASTSAENSTQSKFRSTPLANTTTNLSENCTYDDIQRMMKENPPKPIIVDPNRKPTFVRFEDNVEKRSETNKPISNSDASDDSGANGYSTLNQFDPPKSQDDEEFIVQKPKKKIGRGRGRGVTH